VNLIRVLLADDHQTVREGLKMIVNREPDMEVVGEAADGHQVLERAKALNPDVIIMDISMPGLNGLNATRKLKEVKPDIQIIALTRHNESGYVHELLKAGASGYVLKQSSSEELIRAIRAVVLRKGYLDPAITTDVVKKYSASDVKSLVGNTESISKREAEILRLIASGHSNKEIASLLDISVKTVEAHKANSMRKIGLRSRIDIVNFALLQGWLTTN
jgi:DNA-binding NarL/FixJ family response regulator